jgi:hypothetical protein
VDGVENGNAVTWHTLNVHGWDITVVAFENGKLTAQVTALTYEKLTEDRFTLPEIRDLLAKNGATSATSKCMKSPLNYQKGGIQKPKDLGSLLAKASEAMERAHKFSGTPATITANVAPQAFVDELLKQRRPFKDPGC